MRIIRPTQTPLRWLNTSRHSITNKMTPDGLQRRELLLQSKVANNMSYELRSETKNPRNTATKCARLVVAVKSLCASSVCRGM